MTEITCKSNSNCSVVGCNFTYRNCPSGTKFFSFPNEKQHGIRRKAWIVALKRNTIDGKQWTPAKHSRVCSRHFINGTPTREPDSPGYIPKLHMSQKSHLSQNVVDNITAKYKRKKVRHRPCRDEKEENINNVEFPSVSLTNDASTQTVFTTNLDCCDNMNVLFCSLKSNCDAEVQTNLQPPRVDKNIMTDCCLIRSRSVQAQLTDSNPFCGYESIKNNEGKLLHIAGVKLSVFNILLSMIPGIHSNCTLSKENMLLLFLMKMKLGITFAAIGVIFECHRTTVSASFKFILYHLYEKTKEWIFWPQKSTIQRTMPNSFKKHFENCSCIIDCTEVSCERPRSVRQRILMFSHYKNAFTIKFLVAITPSGFICFISKCYGGRATDSYITVNSGLLYHIQEGDVVMCDKGFPQIKTCLNEKNAVIIMPPFAFNPQFSPEEVQTTYDIASVRIHVERAIQRMKMYKILSNKITIDLLPHIDHIVHIVGVLANFGPPIIKTDD